MTMLRVGASAPTAHVAVAARTAERLQVLVVACGAIARELEFASAGWSEAIDITVERLPPTLHDTPSLIPERVRERIRQSRLAGGWDRILVGYADCGTGGLLDAVCTDEGVERLPGAHCYELFAGAASFAALHDEAPGTFYLTDYLVRCFDRLVVANLGLDRHPELRSVYFGNYTRVVYLAQRDDADLVAAAERAAQRLALPLEVHRTGFGELATSMAGTVAGMLEPPQSRQPLPVSAA